MLREQRCFSRATALAPASRSSCCYASNISNGKQSRVVGDLLPVSRDSSSSIGAQHPPVARGIGRVTSATTCVYRRSLRRRRCRHRCILVHRRAKDGASQTLAAVPRATGEHSRGQSARKTWPSGVVPVCPSRGLISESRSSDGVLAFSSLVSASASPREISGGE